MNPSIPPIPLPHPQRLSRVGGAMRVIRTAKKDVAWMQGPGPSDFWTWTENGEIKAQELSFFGRTVVHRGGHLHTGLSDEDGASPYYGRAEQLRLDPAPNPDTLRAALMVLDAIPPQARSEAVGVLRGAIAARLS